MKDMHSVTNGIDKCNSDSVALHFVHFLAQSKYGLITALSHVQRQSNIKIRTLNSITHLAVGILKCGILIQGKASLSASLSLQHTPWCPIKAYKFSGLLVEQNIYMCNSSVSFHLAGNRKCSALVNIAFELTCVYLNNNAASFKYWHKQLGQMLCSGHTN